MSIYNKISYSKDEKIGKWDFILLSISNKNINDEILNYYWDFKIIIIVIHINDFTKVEPVFTKKFFKNNCLI